MTWPKKGTPEIVAVPKTKSNTTSTFDAVSTTGLIDIRLRVPKRIKQRKLGRVTDIHSTGTATGHCLNFLKVTLDRVDKYPEMKEQSLVMDNASIHSSTDIGKCIHSRGHQYVYLPPYSNEMNTTEKFWVSCQE